MEKAKLPFLSHFTPSLMSHEALEAMFVQREALADRLVECIRDSVLTPSKHYNLLIGPRGIGKTHLVALSYYRVKAMNDLRDHVRLAWMREDEWGVTSFLDLLLRVFRALESEYPNELPKDETEALYQLSSEAAEHRAAELLKAFLGDRTLLLLVENLDELFEGLADEGQKRLRAFLQENAICTILATAQCLFNGISRQTSPFYNFFRIHHLQGLHLEEVIGLLTNIAKLRGDMDLVSFIQTPIGRARIRAVHHLAGGNHRVYIIFSQFLKRESLDELVQPFMNMLDELTPYYQARMKWLSPQQRKIVEFLCDQRGAVPVKEIAQRGFMEHQSVTGQLQKLREMGYVNSTPIGRESYYELHEPLMRLCIEVKKNRGEPLRLFVDFLRVWYTRDELHQRLHSLQSGSMVEREYVLCALRESQMESDDPRLAACLKDLDTYHEQHKWLDALATAEELVEIRGNAEDWAELGDCCCHLEQWERMLESYDKVIELNAGDLRARIQQAKAMFMVGRAEDALSSLDAALKINQNEPDIWETQGIMLWKLGQEEQALVCYDTALKLDPMRASTWTNRGIVLWTLLRYDEALASHDKALELQPDDAHSWYMRGVNLGILGHLEVALASYNRAFELGDRVPCLFFNRIELLLHLGRWEESCLALEEAIQHFSYDETHVAEHSRSILRELFHSTHDLTVWQSYLRRLVSLYDEYNILPALGQGIVASISAFWTDSLTEAAQDWLSAWCGVSGDRTELQLPLRLLSAAVRYRATLDRRVLLSLPVEERNLLNDLIREQELTQE